MKKAAFVYCSCGKKFKTPQTLWDHYVEEQDAVITGMEEDRKALARAGTRRKQKK